MCWLYIFKCGFIVNDFQKKGSNRRTSQRLSKKPRVPVVVPGSTSDDSDSDSEEEAPRKRKAKNGLNNKKLKIEKEEEDEKESDFKAESSDSNSNAGSETKSTTSESKSGSVIPVSRGIHRKFIPKTIFSEDYAVSF